MSASNLDTATDIAAALQSHMRKVISGFEGEVDRIVGSRLRRYGLVFDGVFDGTDEGGRGLAICYFRGPNCKLQIYWWEREAETNCMIAPADAPNEFGLLSRSNRWQFLTRFVPTPDLPLDQLAC